MKQNLSFIFVHGLSGWGSYDKTYKRMPYWGMRGGNLMVFLREKGFNCYAASVSPTGSAWDRACELYAQLAGKKSDYGEVHSRSYDHARFGRDFTDNPLIPSFDQDSRLVLLGHSFGGATIRLFAHLMAHGDEAERDSLSSPPPSGLFAGNMGDRIHSIVTLAAPTNGTTAYDLFQDPDFDPDKVTVPLWGRPLTRMMSMGTKPKKDGRDDRDYADYDMQIDNALSLNRRILTDPSVYYFAVPCSYTTRQEDGTYLPRQKMEPLFVMRSCQIGSYTGKTRGGFEIDDTWRENDGLVNTVSAKAPIGSESKPYDKNSITSGIWNVFPAYKGDHMALQGGLRYPHDIRRFYLALLRMISRL